MDISTDADQKEFLRELQAGKLVIPAIIINDVLVGGYDSFEQAVEEDALDQFLVQ